MPVTPTTASTCSTAHDEVRVVVGGQVVAVRRWTRFLFETGLPVRYYIPEVGLAFADIRSILLSRCCAVAVSAQSREAVRDSVELEIWLRDGDSNSEPCG
jgi:uncharacterized protein (DUF427 family)